MSNDSKIKRKKILVFGTFDILHVGHLMFFQEAKRRTDPNGKLIVIIARDDNVYKIKKKMTIYNESERKMMAEALAIVDKVKLGNLTGSKFDIIEEINPDFIVLGYDQWVNEDQLRKELKKRNLEHIQFKRLKQYSSSDIDSSSKVIERVFQLQNEDEIE